MKCRLVRLGLVTLSIAVMLPALALAQVPPRFYWKTLMGTNGVPVIYQSLSGNANPLDPAHVVSADMGFEADIAIPGYAKMLPLFKRPAMLVFLAPMGRMSGGGTIAGKTVSQSASGYGDPMLEFDINLVGSKPIMNIPDMLRYEPKLTLDLIFDVAFPVGEYQNDRAVNIGQNRWFGRIGAPVVWQLGPWVPGRRTTFELVPSVWLFGDNDDYLEGQRLETKAMFQAEGHLTRDFTEHFWASLDGVWVTGGESSINGQAGSSLNNIGVGYTFGYQLNDSIQLTLGYAATVNDSDLEDLKMDSFRLSFVYGWHKLIEGMNRLEGGE